MNEIQAQLDELKKRYTALARQYTEQMNSAVVILGACEIDDIAGIVSARLDIPTILDRPKLTCSGN